ncbi:MAG: hypothetical protein LQ352_004318 [Teloschistes flavicans]|nr:MAG: hypothetical protein LQ352_004318 [Teloschistes flavicans]
MLSKITISLSLAILAASVHADEWAKLDKPPLADNLDYLAQGLLDNYPTVHSSLDAWGNNGWIPQECKTAAEQAQHSAFDINTYEVHYDDCQQSWVMCFHKDLDGEKDRIIDLVSRLPVRSREYVKHIILLPDTGVHAYNDQGNLVVFDTTSSSVGFEVFLHETGHSLDLQHAYVDGAQLSTSQNWLDNYNQDPKVPDPYSATDALEDVAQNTVVAAYNVQVPGSFSALEPGWQDIFHQYATVQTWQRDAGNLLVPGGGDCRSRLPNSETVRQDGSSGGSKKMMARAKLAKKPDTSLSDDLVALPVNKVSTKNNCKFGQ